MDTGKGFLEGITEEEAEHWREQLGADSCGIFHRGEELELKGSKFTVERIGKKTLKLRIQANQKRIQRIAKSQRRNPDSI